MTGEDMTPTPSEVADILDRWGHGYDIDLRQDEQDAAIEAAYVLRRFVARTSEATDG